MCFVKKQKDANASFYFLVETTGVEPVSENPPERLSPQTVCYLKFPLLSANRHAQNAGSHFFSDRLNGERPMHFYRSHYAPTEFAVPLGGTGGIKSRSTVLSDAALRQRLLRQPEQQYCCRLLFKFEQFSRLLSSLRLSDLGVPVETFTSP